ncbi:hypothetical protein U9M48_019504 [Paspalum notatum var. saurae]|uniref:BED-type domain-containing protein n=1 Tax=Paspalum notatum var. saurae TaxID=547442 RepID=A0AAQ3WRL5_PASNO
MATIAAGVLRVGSERGREQRGSGGRGSEPSRVPIQVQAEGALGARSAASRSARSPASTRRPRSERGAALRAGPGCKNTCYAMMLKDDASCMRCDYALEMQEHHTPDAKEGPRRPWEDRRALGRRGCAVRGRIAGRRGGGAASSVGGASGVKLGMVRFGPKVRSTDLIYSNLRVDRFDPTSAPFRDGAAEEALCPASKLWGCGSGTECWGGVVPSPSYSGRGVPRRCAQLSSPEWIPSDLAVAAFVLRGGAVAVDLRHAVVSLPRSHCLRPHARIYDRNRRGITDAELEEMELHEGEEAALKLTKSTHPLPDNKSGSTQGKATSVGEHLPLVALYPQCPIVDSVSVLSQSRSTITPSPLSSHGRKRKRTPTSTPEVAKVKPSSGQKHEKIVPRSQGAGVQPSNSTERKRTSLQSSTPEVTKVQPSSGENHERNVPRPQGAGVQPSNSTERNETSLPTSTPNGRKMHPSSEENPLLEVEGSDHSGLMKVRVEGTMQSNLEYGDAWVDEEVGAWEDWEDEDMDENPNAGYVEGRIDPEMVDSFLYGEENRQFRSKAWDEFSKIRVGCIVTKGRCNHCNAVISAKRGHGTSAMGTHLKRCKVRKNVTKVTSQLKSAVMSPEGIALKDWRFSQEVSRRELHRMISLHGFPLSVVDYDGFRRFVSSLNPVFKMVSRRTISDDCIKAFQEQKKVLQDVFKNATSRVSLTMDMWKSNQTLGYICITGHFTDSDWKMHKKILKFSFLETPHTGLAMFNVLLKFIQEWNIEDKLFAITLDNASNNNAMMKLLKKNLLDKHMLLGDGTLFHQRCGGHVLNLVCKAGFQVINPYGKV